MTRRQVADFPPEFLQAWELAARGELELSFPTKGKALNFRQQLHTFRKQFIKENGPNALASWFSVDLVVEPGKDCFMIKTSKLDWKKQIEEQAKKAGIAEPQLPPPHIEHPSPIIPPSLQREVMWGQTPDGKPLLNKGLPSPVTPEQQQEARDALSKGLEKLGFTTGK